MEESDQDYLGSTDPSFSPPVPITQIQALISTQCSLNFIKGNARPELAVEKGVRGSPLMCHDTDENGKFIVNRPIDDLSNQVVIGVDTRLMDYIKCQIFGEKNKKM